jgi:hypothetical protein
LKGTHYKKPRDPHEDKEDMGTSACETEKSDLCSNDDMLHNESSLGLTKTKDFSISKSNIREGDSFHKSDNRTNTNGPRLEHPTLMDVDDLQTDSVSALSPTTDLQIRTNCHSVGITTSASPNEYQNTLSAIQNSAHGGKQTPGSHLPNICRSWQWRNAHGLWLDYPDHVNNLINSRLQQRPQATVVIHYNDQR